MGSWTNVRIKFRALWTNFQTTEREAQFFGKQSKLLLHNMSNARLYMEMMETTLHVAAERLISCYLHV